tara:strand:+ start:407 stop:550 length:144 start_codon:yes stop_codon:yes gene_type:complete
MDNIQILKQLLNGNHLEDNELKKAIKIIHFLNIELDTRKKYIKKRKV